MKRLVHHVVPIQGPNIISKGGARGPTDILIDNMVIGSPVHILHIPGNSELHGTTDTC